MITAGCDVGSLTAKAVVLNRRTILGQAVIKASSHPEEAADEVMSRALAQAGIPRSEVRCCVGTGYGRNKIPFLDHAVSEITCHGRGAQWLLPSARTVIDIGGQDCKALRLDRDGTVLKFTTNDKCAAGTGRFLEVMARLLGLSLDELGTMGGTPSGEPLSLSSTCTVWVQAEVIRHLNCRRPIDEISDAINRAMAGRVAILANSVGVDKDVCMTGGVAKNQGVVRHLERLLGVRIKRLRIDPQLTGALGAALVARQHLEGGAA